MLDNYEQAKEFHEIFDPVVQTTPHVLETKEASYRMGFKIEEIVEFLHATAQGDTQLFEQLINELHSSIDQAKVKMVTKETFTTSKPSEEDCLVGQVDAMLDLLYFVNGTFVRMGIDPRPLSEIVHQANMGKVFPDGLPHYDTVTGKVLKPENWEHDFAPEAKLQEEILRQKKASE
ncbi:HAD family hydrolase [Vagococcus zengguangii]|uniref:HAD family hydrolase n=1 Tax=Vagococcus zengguangii TaxID=2571750 RepID=A0A4D7CSS6_9ENTE|nr:HAD family hydrolase [Vagococcus zengguangii]QCI87098.1 HAD family hydrolase [Vagococcus zengguangii]TLG80864.1 HAD family hydrolase [Vagococcus zengguangii]